MKRKLPLQISIFLLLFLFTVAGNSIEGSAYYLRQDFSVRTADATAVTEEQELTKQNSPIAAMSNEAKNTKQVTGEIVGRNGNTVAVKNNGNITNVVLPSNAYVMRNGLDAARNSISKSDYVFATVKDGTIASMTSFSRPVVDALRILLIVSMLTTSYFLSMFVFRFLQSTFTGFDKPGHHLGRRIAA